MRLRCIAFLLFFLLLAPFAFSQCEVTTPSVNPKNNIFTTELEYEFGEIAAERDAPSTRMMDDPTLTSYLNEIGQRIAKKLPPNEIKFRFYVVDEGYANAWGYPGGRIYLTRKLISFVKDEDELAAVLTHEMGHLIVHHGAISWTRIFRNVIDVNSLKTRAEVEEAMNRYFDVSERKGAAAGEDKTEREQIQADEIAVRAMALAGYNPKSAVQFWDRYAGLQGRKGGFFSDLIGRTTEDNKRLREFVNAANALPEGCIGKKAAPTSDFLNWQQRVRTYSGSGRIETVKNVVSKKRLDPPLRAEFDFLRFSSDGKYILAQDEASIFILTREPFAALMRVDAEDAYPALFTPDNKEFVFYTSGLRVERWNIERKELASVEEVHAVRSCIQTRLSPDGKVLACLEPNPNSGIPLQLTLFDTSENKPFYTRKDYVGSADGSNTYAWLDYIIARGEDLLSMNFSPDGHYFVCARGNVPFAVDLTTRKEISLPGSVKKLLPRSFAFLGPDRIIGSDGDHGQKSAVVKFPSGEVLMSDIPLGATYVQSPGHGDFVLLGPLMQAPVGIMDLAQKKIVVSSKSDAVDVYDGMFVSERANGELAIYKASEVNAGPVATAQLPLGPLGSLHAVGMSPDRKYFAVSDRKRGSIWELDSGSRIMYIKGFRGIDFDGPSLYLDFPSDDDYVPPLLKKQKPKDQARERGELPGHSIVKFDLAADQAAERDKFQKKTRIKASAPYFFVLEADKPEEEWEKNVTLTVRDLRTGTTLWTKRFNKKVPGIDYQPGSEFGVFVWDLSESAVRDEVKDDPEAKQRLDAFKQRFESSYFIEVVELRTGKPVAKFPIDTGDGSFKLDDAAVYGSRIFLEDNLNRILVYDFKGQLEGRLYGYYRAASKDGNYVALGAGPGRLNIYDMRNRQRVQSLVFDSRIAHVAFVDNGKGICVLTKDQTVYTINLDATVAAKTN